MAKVKKQPSGNWRVQVYDYTDAKGKRHYKSFTADTKKEAEYQAADHSPKTVRNAHGLLSAVLAAYFPRLQLKTRLPQRVKQEPYIPTAAEVRTLIAAAHDRARLPLMLAAYGGLRRSEICALTPEDFSDV